MTARAVLLATTLALLSGGVHGYRKKASQDAMGKIEKSDGTVKGLIPLSEGLNDEEERVEVDHPVNMPMSLCFKPLVTKTCKMFYEGGLNYKPAREMLQELFDASDADTSNFFAAMPALAAKDNADIKCRDLCDAALDYARGKGLIVPDEHDHGCIKKEGAWTCDVDLSPEHIADEEELDMESTELPDHGDGVDLVDDDNTNPSLLESEVSGMVARRAAVAKPRTVHLEEGMSYTNPLSLVSIGAAVGDGPVPQTVEEMAMKTLRVFRIHVSHPDDDKRVINAEGESSLVDLNATTRASANIAIQTSQVQARAWVSTILAELNGYQTGTYRKKWFGGSGTETDANIRQRLLKVFNFMDRELASMNYYYPADQASSSSCGGSTLAYVWKWRSDEKGYRETQGPRCGSFSEARSKQCAIDSNGAYIVYLCKYWYEKFGEVARTATFVHEAAHHTGPTDVSYEVDTIQNMAQSKQLDNAANYQRFGEDVTLTKWGCADQDVVEGLPFTCGGGPCSCGPFGDMCTDSRHGASVSKQCPATCDQCKGQGSPPRRRAPVSAAPRRRSTTAPRRRYVAPAPRRRYVAPAPRRRTAVSTPRRRSASGASSSLGCAHLTGCSVSTRCEAQYGRAKVELKVRCEKTRSITTFTLSTNGDHTWDLSDHNCDSCQLTSIGPR